MSRRVIIVGRGRVGGSLGKRLEDVGAPVYYCHDYKELLKRPTQDQDIIFLTMPPRVIYAAVSELKHLPGYFVETSSVKSELVLNKPDNLLLAHPLAGTIGANTHWLLGELPPLGVERLLKSIGQTFEVIDMRDHDHDLAMGSHALYLLSEIIAAAPSRGGVMKTAMSAWSGKQNKLWAEIIDLNREEVIKALLYYEQQLHSARARLESGES